MKNMNISQDDEVAKLLEERREKRNPSAAQVCALFSVSVILLLFIASRVQRNEFYSGILITEFILILLPPLIFLFARKYDVKSVLRLNNVSPLNLFLTFCIMLFTIPAVNVLNAMYYILLKLAFGRVEAPNVPSATDAVSLLVNLLVIGASAGICEEVLFRGVILKGFERFGTFLSIFMSSVLFGLWHNYLPSFFGTALLGGMIGFIVYRTNSLYSGMFAHFINNSLAVVIGFVSQKIGQSLNSSGLEGIDKQADINSYLDSVMSMKGSELAALLTSWAFIVLFCAAFLLGLLTAFMRSTSDTVRSTRYAATRKDVKGLAWLLPGLIFIGFMFFANILSLKGIRIDTVVFILKIIGFT